MKTKSKPKIKKNKIPFCPRKIKPIKRIIKINPEIPLIKHHKHPSTPMTILSKKFELKINNKNENKNESQKRNPFHAIIPKMKSYSEKKIRNKKVIVIKSFNNSHKNMINSNNIKPKKNLNNSKSDTKCDTTSGISSVFSDRNIKQRNNKNILEFTFSNINCIKNKNRKTDYINLRIRNSSINKSNTNYSYHNNNNNRLINLKRNFSIKNIKYINQKNNLNNKNSKNNKPRMLDKRSFSKDIKDKRKSKEKEVRKKKNNSKINKTTKIPNEFLSLIPFDKNHQIKKKIINYRNIDNNDNKSNIDMSNTSKSKEKQYRIHKLLINVSSLKFIKTNKSTPKLCIKHPSLKNFFDA